MAKNDSPKQRSLIMQILVLFLIGLGLIMCFLPKQTVIDAGEAERGMILSVLGESNAKGIKQISDQWYTTIFIDTGFLYSTYNFLFDQWDKEGDIELDDRGFSALVEKRLDVVWLVLYQVVYRIAASMIWIPYLLPFTFVVFADGYVSREIRKHRFVYSSPAMVKNSRRIVTGCIFVFIVGPFLPIAVSPFTIPCLVGIATFAIWTGVANMQKRV